MEPPQKILGKQNCVCSLTTLPQSKILMFRGLGEEERTRFRKKKKGKKRKKGKRKKIIVAKSGCIGMKGCLKT